MTQDPQTSTEPVEDLSRAGSPSTISAEPENLNQAGGSDTPLLPWSLVGAIVFFSAVLSVTLIFVAGKFLPGVVAASNTVTFDALRFTNAQRAVASRLAFKGDLSEAQSTDNAIILNQSARVEQTIREVAGPNTLVLVKQAVVDSQYPDITDEVLSRLGLPTNVPSVQPDLSSAGYSGARKLLEAPQPTAKEGVLP